MKLLIDRLHHADGEKEIVKAVRLLIFLRGVNDPAAFDELPEFRAQWIFQFDCEGGDSLLPRLLRGGHLPVDGHAFFGSGRA